MATVLFLFMEQTLDPPEKAAHNRPMAPNPPPLSPKRAVRRPAPEDWPMVRVHHRAQVTETLTKASQALCPVQLVSARDGIASQGTAWFRAICLRGAAAAPPIPWRCVIDCGSAPGHALAALAAGADGVLVQGLAPSVLERLCAIAREGQQSVQTTLPAFLDLGQETALSELKAFLARPLAC